MSDQVVRACLNHWIYRRIGITRILIAVVSVTLITPAQYVLRNRSIAMGRSVVLAFDNSNALGCRAFLVNGVDEVLELLQHFLDLRLYLV